MSPGVVVLVVAVLVALAVGGVLRARAGRVRAVAPGAADPAVAALLPAAGVPAGTGPVLLHFSADWCGPCARVRPVVARVAADLPGLRHAEVDVVAAPELSAALGVLSLPTVVVLDAAGAPRWRVSGVPAAADLVAELRPLLDAPA